MASKLPTIGQWYRDSEYDQVFEVIAIDDNTGSIEIQHEDGALDEYDFESWSQMDLKRTSQAEDAGAGYAITREDEWGADDGWATAGSGNPLSMMEPESFMGTEDF